MAKLKHLPVNHLPIMKACCKTCPFKANDKGHFQNPTLANEVISRTLFKAQQICHGTEGEHREPNNRCKGSYDFNFTIYQRLGLDHLLENPNPKDHE